MMGLPTCNEVAHRLSDDYDRGVGFGDGFAVWMHLLICGACRRYRDYLAWLRHNLPRAIEAAGDAHLSPQQREQLRQALRNELLF